MAKRFFHTNRPRYLFPCRKRSFIWTHFFASCEPFSFHFLFPGKVRGGDKVKYKSSREWRKKKLVEKWPCAEAGHNSDRSSIRCSALDTAKETPKEFDADERSCDLR